MAGQSARRFRILGALGPGLLSPLLVEAPGPALERVVLARPTEPTVAARLQRVDGVVVDREVLETDRGRLGLTTFVDGVDGGNLPSAMTPGAVRHLVSAVAEVLRGAAEAGVRHGGLAPDRVRVCRDGRVVLVRFVGEGDDLDGLRRLALFWLSTDEDEPVADPFFRELLQRWPVSLDGLISELGPADRSVLATLAASASSAPLFPPPAAVVAEKGPGLPPRVQLAAIAVAMLALGAGAAVSLVAWSPRPTLEVSRAQEVRLDCDPRIIANERLPLDAPAVCRVEARLQSGVVLQGSLDGPLSKSYVCSPSDGGLSCVVR